MSYSSLLEELDSPSFDCIQCIFELSKNTDNIGVQHLLVGKLGTYPYSELEFHIPQLVQILVSFETESMALHDLILDYSSRYPHFCVLTFWNLQAYVYELKSQPDSYSFHVVRSFVNRLQNIMFNQDSTSNTDVTLRENFHPALVLSAAIGASLGLPGIHSYVKPIVVSQGKQEKSFLFKLANIHKSLTRNLTLKNRGSANSTRASGRVSGEDNDPSEDISVQQRYSESVLTANRRLSRNSSTFGGDSDVDDLSYMSDYSEDPKHKQKRGVLVRRVTNQNFEVGSQELAEDSKFIRPSQSVHARSMPDLSDEYSDQTKQELSLSCLSLNALKDSSRDADISFQEISENDTRKLKSNYFRKETEFIMVLQNISSRLSQVPKEARLTSLRAELSIINSALLPSQIDIPQLFPTSNSPHKKYHRILKLNVTEACVLNSAERVPYLLLIEYLSEDMDFDPATEKNKTFLSEKGSNNPANIASRSAEVEKRQSTPESKHGLDEADLGDMSIVALSNIKSHFSDHLRATMSKDISHETRGANHPRSIPLVTKYPHGDGDSSPLTHGGKTKDLSAQIRIAAVMLKQLEKSGQANSEQSAAIKKRIIKSMEALQDEFESIDYQQIREISAVHENDNQDAGERKIENDFKIGEDWAIKRARIRKTSAYGHLPHWDLCSVIVKNGEDLQQEALACQLISIISNSWKKDNVGSWTKNMKIVITSYSSGLVETINNALSVHSIKKTMTELSIKNGDNPRGVVASLKDYFLKVYGEESSQKFKEAQANFAKSLAAYSIICYVLQIKDRHNGNIMLDNEGHIIHIDFGFILSNAPGGVTFEAAPFKLTMEYVELLGGTDSKLFSLFTDLCKKSFLSIRKRHKDLINIVDLMQKDSSLPCYKHGAQTSVMLKQRLQLELSDDDCNAFVENNLISKSIGSVYTRLYDQFQLLTQGIYS